MDFGSKEVFRSAAASHWRIVTGENHLSPDCAKCRGAGWLCEIHPDQPFPHDDCPGPGDPCSCNPEQAMPPGTRIIIDRDGGYRH